MQYFRGFLWILVLLVAQAAAAGTRTEALLVDLKPGRRFEVLEDLSVAIPPLLRFLGEIPPLQVTENQIRLSLNQTTTDPVCLVSGLVLGRGVPDQFKLAKGAMIEVKSAELVKKSHPKYVGSAISFSAQALGTSVKATFRCYSGKGAKGTMPVEVFEKLFRRKVRLLSVER